MILTSTSPNVVGRMGIGLGVAEDAVQVHGDENSFFIQSSKDSYDEQSNQEEDGVRILGDSSKEPRRLFKVREPEDIGTNLNQQRTATNEIQRQIAMIQQKNDEQKARQNSNGVGVTILNDSIENQGGNLTKAISDSNGKQNQQH